MFYSSEDLQTMLERLGGSTHTVDDAELFCRFKDMGIAQDEFGRGMIAKSELIHISGDTFQRFARHDTVVDGITWQVVAVRERLSGFTEWSLEREVG